MGWLKRIRERIKTAQVQRRVEHSRFVHLMFNDKFNKPFVDFLNRHFNPAEHLILCKRCFDNQPFPDADNIIELKSFKGLDFGRSNIRQLICHSLFDQEIVDILYENKQWLSRAVWIVWGGDLYDAPQDEVNDYVRGHFVGYWAGVDFPIIKDRYGATGWSVNVAYQFPIRKEMLDRVIASRPKMVSASSIVRVQVNNSCDASTIPILKELVRFKGNGIVVRTVMSYGDVQHKDEILRVGQDLFGVRLETIDEFLTPEQYAQKLDEIDILILNQPRQQGVGNTVASMYLGKKIFIRSDVTTYGFNDMGAKVYDTNKMPSISWDMFVENPVASTNANHSFAMKFLDEDNLAESYRRAFERNVSGE